MSIIANAFGEILIKDINENNKIKLVNGVNLTYIH